MREIKFRAWDLEIETMVKDVHSWYGKSFNSAILMQYTGLKDKNGKEIYSGDLFMDEEDGTYNWVEWNDVYGGWGTNQWFLPKELVEQAPTLEIVGNIYENPELLVTD